MLKDASNIPRISRKFCPSSQIWDPKPPMFIINSLTQFAAGFPSILRHTHTFKLSILSSTTMQLWMYNWPMSRIFLKEFLAMINKMIFVIVFLIQFVVFYHLLHFFNQSRGLSAIMDEIWHHLLV